MTLFRRIRPYLSQCRPHRLRTQVLLADEPANILDQETEDEIMALFDDICAWGDTTLLMVTHARHLARRAGPHTEMTAAAVRVREAQAVRPFP